MKTGESLEIQPAKVETALSRKKRRRKEVKEQLCQETEAEEKYEEREACVREHFLFPSIRNRKQQKRQYHELVPIKHGS